MIANIVKTAVVLCALVACSGVPAAQGQRVEPKPLEASDPQAVRAAAIVKAMLAGDKAAAVKTLQAESEESFVKGKDFEAVLDKQIARLTKAKYTIRDFQTGLGADVVVNLQAASGEETNIVVRFNEAKRVVGFAQAQISQG